MSLDLLIIAESVIVNASADRVYEIISDYRSGHPRILPKQLHSLEVEQGGIGAGTIVRCQLKVFGRNKTFRAEISEPEPGRVLLEKDLATGMETTFTVAPGRSGSECGVTITTKMNSRTGIIGKIERYMIERILRPIYKEELQILKRVASTLP